MLGLIQPKQGNNSLLKSPAYGKHWLFWRVRIIALFPKKQKKYLEHLPVFKARRGADPEQNVGTIHKSNPEHLLIFKAPRGDDPQVQSGKPPCF